MNNDPILADVYRWKDESAVEANYDIATLMAQIMEAQEKHPGDFINVHDKHILERQAS